VLKSDDGKDKVKVTAICVDGVYLPPYGGELESSDATIVCDT